MGVTQANTAATVLMILWMTFALVGSVSLGCWVRSVWAGLCLFCVLMFLVMLMYLLVMVLLGYGPRKDEA